MQRRYSAVPQCSICVEDLGKYGGPATLACGELCQSAKKCFMYSVLYDCSLDGIQGSDVQLA